MKLVPVKVTVAPIIAEAGLTEVMVGSALTLNAAVLVVAVSLSTKAVTAVPVLLVMEISTPELTVAVNE